MSDHRYVMLVHRLSEEDGGGFVAYAPELYGCTADGDTPEAALRDLMAAIDEWLDEAVRLNRPIPQPGELATRVRGERQAMKDSVQELVKIIERQDQLIDKQDTLIRDQLEWMCDHSAVIGTQHNIIKKLETVIAKQKEEIDAVKRAASIVQVRDVYSRVAVELADPTSDVFGLWPSLAEKVKSRRNGNHSQLVN